jgi:hypothetical protein
MRTALFFLLAFITFTSCGSKYPPAENAFDAGREFIDACLKGDFNKASFYMLQNGTNINILDSIQKEYNAKSSTLQQQYKSASIIIGQEETVSDSIHIIYYKNSYDKIAHKLKVVKSNDNWLVDFKYTFNGNL